MSFTAQQEGGKYQQNILQGCGGSYGLTKSTPQYGGKPAIFYSQFEAGEQVPFDVIQPYLVVNIWRRTN